MSKKDEALKLALETSEGIVNADWRKWDELASPSEFERWAKSRANFMATILREALAEPQEKYTYGTPLLDAMTGKESKRWAVFCQGCRKEWTVSYPHPGKSICADCDDKLAEQPAQQALDKKAENARELGLDYEPVWNNLPSNKDVEDAMRLKRLSRLAEQPAQQEPVCAWQREDDDHMPDTWRSDCGVMWTFTDGSPVDNQMKYCCGCGAVLMEKKL